MNFADDIERTIEKLHISTRQQTDDRILEDADAALEKTSKRRLQQSEENIWQRLLRNKIVQYTAVAALFIVISAMFFKSLSPKPADSSRIDAALKKTGNVCISKFHADSTEPYEQVWSSLTLKVRLVRTIENNRVQFTLFDIPNKARMLAYSSKDSVMTEPVNDKMLAELEKSMIQNSGLFTYLNSNEIIEEVHWQRVIDPAAAQRTPGTKTYDVTPLDEAAPGEAKYRKWRIFADADTYLLKRVEFYVKSEPREQYKLESYTIFSYPNEEEVKTLIQNTFGPADRQPEAPGYIGTPGLN